MTKFAFHTEFYRHGSEGAAEISRILLGKDVEVPEYDPGNPTKKVPVPGTNLLLSWDETESSLTAGYYARHPDGSMVEASIL